jgi:hypothetical protein
VQLKPFRRGDLAELYASMFIHLRAAKLAFFDREAATTRAPTRGDQYSGIMLRSCLLFPSGCIVTSSQPPAVCRPKDCAQRTE